VADHTYVINQIVGTSPEGVNQVSRRECCAVF